jgi:integrase
MRAHAYADLAEDDHAHPLAGTMSALKRLKISSVPSALGFVVVDAIGQPVAPKSFSERFATLARGAEVPTIHLHSTRHTIACLLHDAGVPPVRAAAFLGHTLAVHLSVYLFAREDDVDAAAGALGQVLAAATARNAADIGGSAAGS